MTILLKFKKPKKLKLVKNETKNYFAATEWPDGMGWREGKKH